MGLYLTEVARICHETNRAYCNVNGDFSQPRWENAPEWQKDSARAGVTAVIINPDLHPSQSHESWSAQKTAEGWVYGEVKDPEKKTHPCLVEYDELPAEQQAKDHLFVSVVRTLIPFIEQGTINDVRNQAESAIEGVQETIPLDGGTESETLSGSEESSSDAQSEGSDARSPDASTVGGGNDESVESQSGGSVSEILGAQEESAEASADEDHAEGRDEDSESESDSVAADGAEDDSSPRDPA